MKFAGVVAYIHGSNGGWFSVYGGLSGGRAAKGLFSLTPSLLCFRMSILLEGPRERAQGEGACCARLAAGVLSLEPPIKVEGGNPLTSTHTHHGMFSTPTHNF